MSRLVATLGTQPGSSYETLLNICRGNYDYGDRSTPPLSVSEVVLVHTRAQNVLDAYHLAKILIACQGHVLPDELKLPEHCRIKKIIGIPVDIHDVDSRQSFEEFKSIVERNISKGDIVDVSGGRVAMAIAAAFAARQNNALVVATVIPSQMLQQIDNVKKAILATFDVKDIVSRLEKGSLGCRDLVNSYPELARKLSELVTGRARTYVLYP